MDFREINLEQQLEKITKYPSVESVYLFGSRAYRTGSTRSDVDILIYSPDEEIPDDCLLELFKDEPALDLFLTRDLRDAKSVINSSHIFKEDLIKVIDAVLVWSKSEGIIHSAIEKLGTIRVRKGIDFQYSRLPLQPDPYQEQFHNKYGANNVFMMMPFGDSTNDLYSIIKDYFTGKKIKIVRADEHNFTGGVWSNVKTHMDSCEYGIALFNKFLDLKKKGEVFNPNVALEVGYMLAQGKPVCILKDKSLKNLFCDLASKYYYEYDSNDIDKTIPDKLQEWMINENIPG